MDTKVMQAVVKRLQEAGIEDVSLEYPAYIAIGGKNYTANEDWGWSDDQGGWGSLEISSKSEDDEAIASAILAHQNPYLKLELTRPEVDALSEILDLAIGDQEDYLNCGDPHIDYGAEWPETANQKAERLRRVAAILRRLGLHGQDERCKQVANGMEASGREYKEMRS